jgi:16S rRNA (cytidine1402-2'-O)-methyltransferase
VISFHAHSPEDRIQRVIEILSEGRDVALVTDAGTPGISDPGAELVAAVRIAGLGVVPLPGPSAVVTALSASGLPADRHLFLGFIPRKGRERKRLLQLAAESEWTVVTYEAANRLTDLLRDLIELTGPERAVVVARELTKLHEEFRAGTLTETLAYYEAHPPLGEVTVVLAGTSKPVSTAPALDPLERARELLADGLTRKAAAKQLTLEAMIPRNDAYRIVMGVE